MSVLKFASVNLTDNKNVFLICTYGGRLAVFYSWIMECRFNKL